MRKWMGLILLLSGCSSASPMQVTSAQVTSASATSAPAPAPAVAAEPPALLPTASKVAEPSPFPALRPYVEGWGDYDLSGLTRSRLAKETKTPIVKQLFADAGVAFPPKQLLLRAYKKELELEVWASSTARGELTHVTTYGICAGSGKLGPKRQEGDYQVPEGFYKIQYLWPQSSYYLSMKVSYPNHSDKILTTNKQWPGSDIMIHGACASIGCLAMSDERIQELWAIASPVQTSAGINVHIFPTRDREALRSHPSHAKHEAFWDNIYQGHDMFVSDKRMPRVSVGWDGRYSFASAKPSGHPL